MSQKWHLSSLLIAVFLMGFSASAQTPRSYLWETEFDLELPAKGKWGFTFGAGNRYLFAEEIEGERVSKNTQKHIEFNHFTIYNSSQKAAISLGLRYRFREVFDEESQDEFRIIEQFEYTHQSTFLTPEHRLRFEQRFREATIFRLRYQLEVSQPLNEAFAFGLSTEFLYSMVKDLRPEVEQRFGLEVENYSFKDLELTMGLEFRRDDLTGFPGSEFFLFTAAVLQL
jgi:hypothetical protein